MSDDIPVESIINIILMMPLAALAITAIVGVCKKLWI